MVFLILLCYLISNDYIGWKRNHMEACAAGWILGIAVVEFFTELTLVAHWFFSA